MHLVALTHLFYPARGGTEISLLELAKRLVGKGHRVTVVTSNQIAWRILLTLEPILPGQEKNPRGIRIIRLPLTPRQRFFLAKTGALALRSGLLGGDALWFKTQVPYLPQMIRTARELKPDLIYAVPFPTASIYYASVAAKKIGRPWVIQPHLHFKDINASLIKIIRRIFPRASAILTNTQAEKNYLIRQGLQGDKIHPLGQGIDLALLEGGNGLRFRCLWSFRRTPDPFSGPQGAKQGDRHPLGRHALDLERDVPCGLDLSRAVQPLFSDLIRRPFPFSRSPYHFFG